MANMELLDISEFEIDLSSLQGKEGVVWIECENHPRIKKVPQIFFSDGSPFRAANKYAIDGLNGNKDISHKTVVSNMSHIKAYADWLEESEINWLHFPIEKKERCLFRFRGWLVSERKSGNLKPSTVTARMAAVIRFYRWAREMGWGNEIRDWDESPKIVKFHDKNGFSRTMNVLSTELHIPNRKRNGGMVEDGLLPLMKDSRDKLLLYLSRSSKSELYLMVLLGVFTGARSETIRTLRVSSLECAVIDPMVPKIKRIPVGPGTKVTTKFNVTGHILVPEGVFSELEDYSASSRRFVRQLRADPEDKDLVFLTRSGNGYSDTTFTKLVSDLRNEMIRAGLHEFENFKFHQTRATYGTQMMLFALEFIDNKSDAVRFVRDAMMHKNESTTWKYIRFIEEAPIKEAMATEFYNIFTGVAARAVRKKRAVKR